MPGLKFNDANISFGYTIDEYGKPTVEQVNLETEKMIIQIIKEADSPYEALCLKYGKDKVEYNENTNTYLLIDIPNIVTEDNEEENDVTRNE